MSGVNCTRRNSTPIARANALASKRLGDTGHAFEQHVTADGRPTRAAPRRRRPGRRRPCGPPAPRDRAARSRRSPIVLRHARRRSRPSASAASSSVGGCQIAARSGSEYPSAIAARSSFFGRCVGPEVRHAARCAPAPTAASARARAPGSCVRSRLTDERAHVFGARPAAARAAAGRADRTAGCATTRTRARRRRGSRARPSTASGSRRARGSRRSRARLRRSTTGRAASPASPSANAALSARPR